MLCKIVNHFFLHRTAAERCINVEDSIISTKKWEKTIKNGSDIQVSLYAFRFVKSANVVIECAANVCSSHTANSCTQVKPVAQY